MAKITGLNMTMLCEDEHSYLRDISQDIRNFSFDSPINLIDVTGIDKAVMERLRGLADISLSLNGVFNPTGSHGVMRSTPSSDTTRKVIMVFKKSDNEPAPRGGTDNIGDNVASTDGEFSAANTPPGANAAQVVVVIDVLFNSYNVSRGDDGAMTWTSTGESAIGKLPYWTTLSTAADALGDEDSSGLSDTAAELIEQLNGERKV